MNTCTKCKKRKSNEAFYIRKTSSNGLRSQCIQCENSYSRTYNLINNHSVALNKVKARKKRQWAPEGFLTIIYKNMSQRTKLSRNDRHWKYYVGIKVLFPLEWFISSQVKNTRFLKLYKYWKTNGCKQLDIPGIDRIDSDLHYSKDNIQWLTMKENSFKARLLREERLNHVNS